MEFEEMVRAQLAQGSSSKRGSLPQSTAGAASTGDIDRVMANVFGQSSKPQSSTSESSTPNAGQLDDAMKPVAIPAPQPKSKKTATPVQTDRAPTVDDVLDPQRPDLGGASHELVLQSIERIVNDIYNNVLNGRLDALATSLAKTAPPPATPFALSLLSWVVDSIAAWTVGSIGRIAAKELFGHAPAAEEPKAQLTVIDGAGVGFAGSGSEQAKSSEPTGPTQTEMDVAGVAASAGSAAGGALKSEIMRPRPTAAPAVEEDVPLRAAAGETLLAEFIARQRNTLHARKNDAITALALIRVSAVGKAQGTFVDLDAKLRNLINSPDLGYWFQQKVTMEWLNFVARVSLGPRAAGQATDMAGANTIGGIASAGLEARSQWTGAAGFVEITFRTPDVINGVDGLAMESARIPSSYGAMRTLKESGAIIDRTGKRYTLATLPVYRRIWLQTGSSKLTVTPAFVITPEGNIEADVGNPVLAAIGAGHPIDVGETTYGVGGDRFASEGLNPLEEWRRRAVNASECNVGAHLVHGMLRQAKPKVLQ